MFFIKIYIIIGIVTVDKRVHLQVYLSFVSLRKTKQVTWHSNRQQRCEIMQDIHRGMCLQSHQEVQNYNSECEKWFNFYYKHLSVKLLMQCFSLSLSILSAAAALNSLSRMTVIPLNLSTCRLLNLKNPWMPLKSFWLLFCSYPFAWSFFSAGRSLRYALNPVAFFFLFRPFLACRNREQNWEQISTKSFTRAIRLLVFRSL